MQAIDHWKAYRGRQRSQRRCAPMALLVDVDRQHGSRPCVAEWGPKVASTVDDPSAPILPVSDGKTAAIVAQRLHCLGQIARQTRKIIREGSRSLDLHFRWFCFKGGTGLVWHNFVCVSNGLPFVFCGTTNCKEKLGKSLFREMCCPLRFPNILVSATPALSPLVGAELNPRTQISTNSHL